MKQLLKTVTESNFTKMFKYQDIHSIISTEIERRKTFSSFMTEYMNDSTELGLPYRKISDFKT